MHASLTIIRQRLPESVFDKVFVFVLSLLEQNGLVRGKSVAIDATTLEANAAMKSIVRKDTGEDWTEYLRGLAQAEGIQNPTEEDLRRLNRWRSERCERTFAHVCETGGGRRAWLRGQTNVSKLHTLKCAAHNWGLWLRKMWGLCKPRNAQAAGAALFLVFSTILVLATLGTNQAAGPLWIWLLSVCGMILLLPVANRVTRLMRTRRKKCPFLTGC